MAHPLIWPSKYFFYAIGNTSAVSVTMDLSPEEPARILLLGCGDPRNILYTVFTEKPNSERLLDFTCCDIDPGVLGRNVLLFTLIADGHPETEVWNIFFHFKLDEKSHTILIEQCKKLIDLAETAQKWRKSSYGGTLKMSTDYTLSEIRRHWELYVAMPDLPSERRNAINQEFVAIWRNNSNNGHYSTAWRSLGPVMLEGLYTINDSLQHYWKTGTTFRDGKNIAAATILNPTFVYSLAGEGCSLHYGTDPLTPFHLAPIFAGSKPNPTILEVVKAVKAQFSDWCSSYRKALSSPSPPIVRSFVGEATAVCHAIRVFANSGALNPGIPVAQWKTQLVQFSQWEYVDSPTPAPTDFNVIHTSNLEDHIGLLNILIPATPLLSPTPSSVLYTESLLWVGDDATKEFIEHLHGDITVMGLILGVCPVDYLSGFTTRSNTHELLMNLQTSRGSSKGSSKGKKSKDKSKEKLEDARVSQFQQLVTWKAPTSCDPIASQLPVPRPSYDPYQMSTFLYDMYQSLYATESAMNFWSQNQANPLRALQASNITTHYTREAFVLFLKIIKDRLQPTDDEWRTTIEGFNERLLSTWSRMNMETMHYQDLCGHLVRYGLYRAQSFEPRARKMGPFAAWNTIPDLIRIVLVVPRDALWVLEGSKPEEVGTPPLQCDITGVNCSNLFTSVHAAFGRAVSFGTPANPQVRFEEDIKGWKGKSSLVVSFTAPSYLLTELEPYQSLTVNFAVRNTPAACMTLIKKLGIQLRIYSAKLMDSSLVHILPESPLPARRRNPGQPSPRPQPTAALAQIGEADRAVLQFNEDCEEVSTLGVRISLTDEKSVQLFSSEGSKVVPELEQISACVIRVKLGERIQDLAYPFPVMGSQHRLRLARKSRYIEVLVPTSRSFALDGMKLNPYPVIRNGSTVSPWSVHRVPVSMMPAVNLNAKGFDQWLNPHVGSMMSKRERSMRKKHKHDALMYVKDTIHSIMVGASGIQNGPPRRLFSLTDEQTNNCDTIIFISDVRFDLASHTVVCDGYVLPLTKAFLLSVETQFAKLVTQGNLASIPVFDGEMQSWKQLLPSFVERCRTTWTHGPNCEYLSQGRIPLTEDMEKNPLCSCGKGKDVEGMKKVDLWKPFASYVTRIAISPLFAVSYLETVGRSSEPRKCSVCRGKGKPSLKACSGCKKTLDWVETFFSS
ncbi:hypothetical protein H1R20_g9535, partial [Candolleomyces eurysporus]